MKKYIAGLLVIGIVLSFCACGGSSDVPVPSAQKETEPTQEITVPQATVSQSTYDPVKKPEGMYSLSAQQGIAVSVDPEQAQQFLASLEEITVTYPEEELFQLPEVMHRLEISLQVDAHTDTSSDVWDAQKLTQRILSNNEAYLQAHTFGFESTLRDKVYELCTLILNSTEKIFSLCPEMDRERIGCVLWNMKILNKPGMLAFAQVNNDRVLCISDNSASILENLQGEGAMEKVLVHETMHLLQIGCPCENAEGLDRRAGVCVAWKDFSVATTDWTWLVEASAERNMCDLLQTEPTTYEYLLRYLTLFDLALLPGTAEETTLQQLSFYADVERLFSLFPDLSREDLVGLMIATQLEAVEPKGFLDAYAQARGVALDADPEVESAFYLGLREGICRMLTRVFYGNLLSWVESGSVTQEDVCLMISLFEGQVNSLIKFTRAENQEPYGEFLTEAKNLRESFFRVLGLQPSVYDDYTAAEGEVLNAQLLSLKDGERSFLVEEAAALAEWNNFGAKIN